MTISITPQLESLIKEKLASGRYHSADEVMREALRLLELRDEQEQKLEQLRQDIQAGLDSGDPIPFDKEAIRKLARQKL
jgi:antitoxin ParD1/3/4